MFSRLSDPHREPVMQKIWQINWVLMALITGVACVGFVVLYSAANGSIDPWAGKQMTRFAMGMVILMAIAVIDIRLWIRYAYLLYFLALLLLVGVEFFGVVAQGARRWIFLGGIKLQPSEFMKIGVILALAKYFHETREEDVSRLKFLVIPIVLAFLPTALIMKQPDLGTAGLVLITAISIFFASGVSIKYFIAMTAGGLAAVPVAWQFLHTYQKKRILTFLNPEQDPLGSGYHIIQSKIALGSGGLFGQGYMSGSQSHLNFLPEKQTDFIFTMIGEEFGLFGTLSLVALYVIILIYGYAIALTVKNQFGRIVSIGVLTNFFLYLFINIAMVMGLFPVVGVPLPLVSYGGTAMLAVLIGFGFLMNAWVHRDVHMGRLDY